MKEKWKKLCNIRRRLQYFQHHHRHSADFDQDMSCDVIRCAMWHYHNAHSAKPLFVSCETSMSTTKMSHFTNTNTISALLWVEIKKVVLLTGETEKKLHISCTWPWSCPCIQGIFTSLCSLCRQTSGLCCPDRQQLVVWVQDGLFFGSYPALPQHSERAFPSCHKLVLDCRGSFLLSCEVQQAELLLLLDTTTCGIPSV